jgi:hypothetical protein
MLITSDNGLISAYVTPHEEHIQKLKEHADRNHFIVVWSAGGYEWAEAVVKGLGLNLYVDLIITKPRWAWDDLPMDEAIDTRCYIKPKGGDVVGMLTGR